MFGLTAGPHTRETVAYTRYADVSLAEDDTKYVFQHPGGEPLRRSFTGDLFKFQKPDEHWAQVRRSKSYIADAFFPPIALKSHDLISMFERDAWKEHQDFSTEAYLTWREDVLTLLPRLGVEALIELGYFLSFEAKLNDKAIWKAFEGAVLESIHLIDLKHACQL